MYKICKKEAAAGDILPRISDLFLQIRLLFLMKVHHSIDPGRECPVQD